MIKYFSLTFVAFSAIVILYALIAALSGALTSRSFFSLPSSGSPAGFNNSVGGLTAVDFSLFARGGKGWNYVTQGYGYTSDSYRYIGDWHNGIDIAARYGAPIYSPIANGAVLAVGDQDNYCPREGFGKFVVVQDKTNQLMVLFAHLGTIAVAPGAAIAPGATIGTIGTTGLETGTHLHLSIFNSAGFSMTPAHGCGPYPEGHDIDPLPYLKKTY